MYEYKPEVSSRTLISQVRQGPCGVNPALTGAMFTEQVSDPDHSFMCKV